MDCFMVYSVCEWVHACVSGREGGERREREKESYGRETLEHLVFVNVHTPSQGICTFPQLVLYFSGMRRVLVWNTKIWTVVLVLTNGSNPRLCLHYTMYNVRELARFFGDFLFLAWVLNREWIFNAWLLPGTGQVLSKWELCSAVVVACSPITFYCKIVIKSCKTFLEFPKESSTMALHDLN